jgi:hypothetical protein
MMALNPKTGKTKPARQVHTCDGFALSSQGFEKNRCQVNLNQTPLIAST